MIQPTTTMNKKIEEILNEMKSWFFKKNRQTIANLIEEKQNIQTSE